jgi:hypothetical protein
MGNAMFEGLAERVNADAALVQRGRFVNASMLLESDGDGTIVRIDRGAVTSVSSVPLLMADWTFALRAPREAWEAFFAPRPAPGFTDIFALQKRKLLRIEGNLQPFMANLLYFKDVLATLRRREAA